MATLAAMVAGGLLFAPAVRSQQAEPKKPAAANAGAENRAAAKAPRRLPQYYARVVEPTQREQIYGIQAKYHEQIQALEEQLKALIEKRDAEIEAVLTPEQREALAKLKAEAAAARKQSAAEDAPAQPANPPATAKKPASGN